jgi:hypothetical protein
VGAHHLCAVLPHRMCCAAAPGVLPRSRFCRSLLWSERARKRALSCVWSSVVFSSSERARERALSHVPSSVVLLSSERARLSRVSSVLVLLPSRRARERAQSGVLWWQLH